MPRGDRRKVTRSVHIQASPERVLRAFLDVEQMKQWWGATRGLVEERRGGVWTLAWGEPGQGYKYVVAAVVKSILPGKRLRLEPLVYFNAERAVLGPMRLSISVRERGGKTRVSVRQDGYGEGPDWDWYYQAVVQGWKDTLANLKEYLESQGSERGPS
ncbi:SRPBCC domain-containing protein [Acidobacteriia bacterium AH_259_A11_L15]|nr:SRPBCC domain-containing protein [Acidobacteriia bacterium AH_259_A11_L15]